MRYDFGRCRLDTGSRELTRNGAATHLSPKAFELLRALIEARPRVLTKAELMQRVWPDAYVVEANLPVLVGEVRTALGEESAASSVIKTHHAVGYSFIADVRESRTSSDTRLHDGRVFLLRTGSRRVALGVGTNVIGRNPGCDVYVNDNSVSKSHARIVVENGVARIEDLNSKNGTTVQGVAISAPTVLNDGDEIEFGGVKAWFIIDREDDSTTMTL